MRVVITGSHGQVGSALVDLVPAGVQVAALSRSELDITDPAALADVLERLQPDWLLNAAAYTAVDRAESDEKCAFRINSGAVDQLATAASKRGIRMVHFSTDFVFNGTQSHPYSPAAAVAPISVYGRSKRAGEQAALNHAGNLVLRTAWVYSSTGANFVNTMLRLMSERESLGVVSDQLGTPTHAASLARATWALVAQKASGLHHFTDAGVASWYDFAVAIQEEARSIGRLERAVPIFPIATADYPTAARRPFYSVLDCSATWAALGHPPRHWRSELRAMLAEMKGIECPTFS
jgi:dTDP-4-dehydrorhamnose reductase